MFNYITKKQCVNVSKEVFHLFIANQVCKLYIIECIDCRNVFTKVKQLMNSIVKCLLKLQCYLANPHIMNEL